MRDRTLRLFIPPLLLAALFSWHCGGRQPSYEGANVILISLDTVRSDHLPAYGYEHVQTPAIDGLARDGIVYERAYSQYPLTLPSHATLFSGKLPPAHGVRENGSVLGEQWQTMASALKERGYRTAAFVSAAVLGRRTGLDRGFDLYQDQMAPANGAAAADLIGRRAGEETVSLAQAWLSNQDRSPFFLFVHLYDAHTPYQAPEPYASRYEHPYDGEIARTDAQVGRLIERLKQLGLYDNAIVILLSDHGEGLGEHGEETHGIFVYRESIQVPLIIKLPGPRAEGRRVRQPVGLVDVKATLFSLLATACEESDGMALLPGPPPKQRPIYSESYIPLISYGWSPLKSAIQRKHHYIQAPRPEWYDLGRDPAELHNQLPGATPPATLTAFLEAVEEGSMVQADLSAEDQAILESLGYVGRTNQSGDGRERDPKDFIHQVRILDQIRVLRDSGRSAEAEVLLHELLLENPAMSNARTTLAKILELQERIAELEPLYEDGLRLEPTNLHYMELLTLVKLKLGKLEQARLLARFIHENDRGEANDKICYFFQFYGQREFALQLARETVERGHGLGYAPFVWGTALRERGKPDLALPLLTRAAFFFDSKGEKDFAGAALYQEALCYQVLHRSDEAMATYRKVLERHPDHLESRMGLALLYGKRGDRLEAIKTMDEMVREFPSQAHYQAAARVMRQLGYKDAAAFYQRASASYPVE